jgi:hypothetical protein
LWPSSGHGVLVGPIDRVGEALPIGAEVAHVPRRSDSLRTYVRSTRIVGGISVLVLSGAVVWDLVSDEFCFATRCSRPSLRA